jgi:hypothetical protein
MITPLFLGTTKGGKLIFHDKQRFLDYVNQLGDGIVEMTLKKRRRTRSLNQNAYYWGVVCQLISDYTGMTPDEVHEYLKSTFNYKMVKNFKVPISTTNLNSIEFGDYITKIKIWASIELHLNIPDPYTIDLS